MPSEPWGRSDRTWSEEFGAEGQAGRFKRYSATPGCARTSLHPGLLFCHHSVVRRRRFGVGSM